MPNGRAVRYDVVIVGGGHGGAQAAIALRAEQYAGSIAIVGEEPHPPYERPPLSKDYLAGKRPFERILIRRDDFWRDRAVTLRSGERVVAVDPVKRVVTTADGATIGYGKLIWATGGYPRRLACPGHALAGVHYIRTRGDIDRLVAELPDVRAVAIIGGGYIGLEAAAVLTRLGKEVTLLEAQERVLARVAGPALSHFYAGEHRAQGVDLLLERTVTAIEGTTAVTGVRLDDGTLRAAQMVVVGIGIVPAVEPLLDAGAAGGSGVLVDGQCRTSLDDVFAIGDCAEHATRWADGATIRLESVQNANDQATVAARTIVGREATYGAVPWFWSDQYDLKLQTVGLSIGHDTAVLRGDPATRSFSVVYLRNGRVVALDCVNRTRDFVQGKALVEAQATIDPALLADADVPLKTMLEG